MRMTVLIFALIFLIFSFAIGQTTYTVLTDDRNAAIELTQNAVSDISNKDYVNAFNKLKKSIEIDSLYRDAYLHIYQLYTKYPKNTEKVVELLKKGKRIFEEDDELPFSISTTSIVLQLLSIRRIRRTMYAIPMEKPGQPITVQGVSSCRKMPPEHRNSSTDLWVKWLKISARS